MKFILDKYSVPSKIWLLHDINNSKFHTVLTFYLENKTVYLELTPQSDKAWYGKEIIFDSEQSFVNEYKKNDCDVIDVTDDVIISKAPDFLLLWMV
jgi:hypothetical protein